MDSDDYFQRFLLQVVFQESFVNVIIVSAVILILLFLIGVFSVGERSLSSLSPEEMGEIGGDRGDHNRLVKQLTDDLTQTRAIINIVQTIHYVAFVLISVYGVFSVLDQGFYFTWVYLLLALFLVFVLYVCNSVVPAYMVRSKALQMACVVAPYIRIAGWIFRPLTSVCNPSYRGKRGSAESNSKEGVEEKDMFQEIVHFYRKTTEEIMVPRMDMKAIDIKCHFDGVLDIAIRTGFSRIPVYEDTEDDIKGILYVKDLLHSVREPDHFEWRSLIRPAYFIPETKKIDDLLEEFRSNKIHIAIVVDEFGCTSGLVTMEDVIEEIVGEISDEYDVDKRHFFVLPNGDYIFEGKIPLVDFFRETDIDPSVFGELTDEVDTLAGLLMEIKGTLPCRREAIDYQDYHFQILEADERRVLKIKFSKINKPIEEKDSCEV